MKRHLLATVITMLAVIPAETAPRWNGRYIGTMNATERLNALELILCKHYDETSAERESLTNPELGQARLLTCTFPSQ